MTDRLRCAVPHCRRSKRADEAPVIIDGKPLALDEWICPTHWRPVRRDRRAVFAAAKRILRRKRTERAARLMIWLWQRCKREAIECAGGLQ
ncbi:hypothetical protein OSH11_13725 [Kaistia dalseonensis]|uniref:Uncharacterized protein n=1 Tax=Kaistia dalseonensis TaxID=410840 RepID=A0ABU0H7S6_9HYPH|nr:hypothetical protein [Kaistia dalseonensis]MCX5495768.1 hypothetical protein [Kaistia dalseonensis]MDQ0438368.1 hypothetical protein [Kaistia dalseonensis]